MEPIREAIRFALKAHGNQTRKSSPIPYFWHPLGVGRLLAEEGCDKEVVAAGVLHDVLEDTPVTEEELRARFGDRIARLVAAVSEPDKSLSWEERKEGTIRSLAAAGEEVRLIVAADKLDNLRSIARDRERLGDAVWDRFNRGKAKQAWYHRSLSRILGARRPLFAALARETDLLFGPEAEETGPNE